MGNRLWRKIRYSNFFIKLKSWEYWPFGIIQFPFFFYWFWLSLRARSFLFFSASNPGILTGGMFGESKYDILKKIPHDVTSRSVRIKVPAIKEKVLSEIKNLGLSFPVIFKPDLGERGWMVKRIENEKDVAEYLHQIQLDFIVQELIDLPVEAGVFYRRFPDEKKGRVTSIVLKEMLSVTGDGTKSLQQLILEQERSKLQWEKLQFKYRSKLNHVPAKGEMVELVSIGNHCLGTKFLDGCHLITEELNAAFDSISKQIDGFYFGRYDLRAASFEDLARGNVKILELNGCGAEPAHIYQPGFSLWKALVVMHRHWKDMYRVSVINHRRGVPYMSFSEGIQAYKKFKTIVGK